MPSGSYEQASGPPGRVLLIGEIREAFVEPPSDGPYVHEFRPNVLDGIDAAGRERFTVVALAMKGLTGRLGPVLRALRKATDAKLVLLARMHEEPIARQLTTTDPQEGRPADGYLVCPAHVDDLYAYAEAEPETPGPSDVPVQPPAAAESKGRRVRWLEWLATTDDLTGLRNRRYIREFARQVLERAARKDRRVTLLLFDIDNFKHYNDVYGHATGDEILRQVATLIRRSCRSHDVVGRIGGDEFAVIFWEDSQGAGVEAERDRRSASAEHPTEAISVARRFRKDLGDADLPLLGAGGEGVLTISGGLASFPRQASTVEELFERADRALLEAKRSGKNRIYIVGQPQNDVAGIE